jgi:hypothetical protein
MARAMLRMVVRFSMTKTSMKFRIIPKNERASKRERKANFQMNQLPSENPSKTSLVLAMRKRKNQQVLLRMICLKISLVNSMEVLQPAQVQPSSLHSQSDQFASKLMRRNLR